MKQRIQEAFRKINIELTDNQASNLYTYYEMLVEWNKVMNLTGITEFEDVLLKHFIDSVAVCQITDMSKVKSVMDVGTGAGFPGIPLKIAFPNLKITLADSLNKRILFLDDVIRELALENIETVHDRAEDLAHNVKYREQYDLVVSRAVANLSTLCEYSLPFIKIGGKFVSYKSGDCDNEILAAKSAIFLLGGKLNTVDKFELGDAGRSFIVIDKVNGTSKKYPRKAGLPSKKPL